MFSSPLNLQLISQLRDPKDRVPLSETRVFEEGEVVLETGCFVGYDLKESPAGALRLKIFFSIPNSDNLVTVQVNEKDPGGDLSFICGHCGDEKLEDGCSYLWASYSLLVKLLTRGDEEGLSGNYLKLYHDLEEPLFTSKARAQQVRGGIPKGTVLESVSLVLDDLSFMGGDLLGTHFNFSLEKYRPQDLANERDSLSPHLWNMPEVFRRKLSAYSGHYLHEVNEQNRLAGMLRYNFSNGMQISAKEILRHPIYKYVDKELLPEAWVHRDPFQKWPLTQQKEHLFVSQTLREVEDIMQSLFATVFAKVNTGALKLYVQSSQFGTQGLEIKKIDFDVDEEFYWRVDFHEKNELLSEFQLLSRHQTDCLFFDSFALDKKTNTLWVHAWQQEWKFINESLKKLGAPEGLFLSSFGRPSFDLSGEAETKNLLRRLRNRRFSVELTGKEVTLSPSESLTEIHLQQDASFFIQHNARVLGQKDLLRKGWTPKSVLFLKILSDGLPALFHMEPKELAARARTKREWDLKILKHLGVVQYLFFETLNYHFDGQLSDGAKPEPDEILNFLHERIQALLVSGSGLVLAKEQTLSQLCSRSVLVYFEEFVEKTLETLKESESFYSESGEITLDGIVEREFHLIYEILKKMAVSSGGELFKKARTPLLTKIWTGNKEKDPFLTEGSFFLPKGSKDVAAIHETLETFQVLIPFGFKLLYKGQPLQELTEDEFQVDFSIQSEHDDRDFNWFELNPRFFLRGQEVQPGELSNFGSGGVIEYEGKLFLVPRKQMPSLRRLENFWQKLQKGEKTQSRKNSAEKIFQLPYHQVLELLALRASGYKVRGDAEWQSLCEFYDNIGTEKTQVHVPDTVTADLKNYQRTGVQWLMDLFRLKLGALLADDMGLGKTLQTLAFLDTLREQKELGQVLVVVPSSLIFNWQQEVEKFTPKIPLTVFTSKDIDRVGKRLEAKEDLVVITTYGLLMENEEFLSQYRWQVLIFDEAQNLKNITTKRTSSARALAARFKICLTGTPMENHYGEFYSLIDLIVPGSLGKVDEFRRKFVNTEIVTREEIDDLKLKIKPLLLRRTKKEILDQLPEKQETKVSIAFEERQMEIYRDIALSYNERVQESLMTQGEASVQLQMLTALLRLRQACSDPSALPNVKYDRVPPKLEALRDSLTEIVSAGESALVFTQFLQTLERTASMLKAEGIPVFVLHGGIPTKQRQKILSDFNQTAGGAVLVMTLKTGGVGLNLTKASYVFHLEPWWNPSVENQATDRAHRLGQSKAVQVFRYIMHESLEEKIELLKTRKDKKFQTLFAQSESEADLSNSGNALSKEDFDFLLGIKK